MNNFKKNIFKTRSEVVLNLNCKRINITISPIDTNDSDDGTVNVFYYDCFLVPTFQSFPDAGTYNNAFCAVNSSSFSFTYQKGGATLAAVDSFATITETYC